MSDRYGGARPKHTVSSSSSSRTAPLCGRCTEMCLNMGSNQCQCSQITHGNSATIGHHNVDNKALSLPTSSQLSKTRSRHADIMPCKFSKTGLYESKCKKSSEIHNDEDGSHDLGLESLCLRIKSSPDEEDADADNINQQCKPSSKEWQYSTQESGSASLPPDSTHSRDTADVLRKLKHAVPFLPERLRHQWQSLVDSDDETSGKKLEIKDDVSVETQSYIPCYNQESCNACVGLDSSCSRETANVLSKLKHAVPYLPERLRHQWKSLIESESTDSNSELNQTFLPAYVHPERRALGSDGNEGRNSLVPANTDKCFNEERILPEDERGSLFEALLEDPFNVRGCCSPSVSPSRELSGEYSKQENSVSPKQRRVVSGHRKHDGELEKYSRYRGEEEIRQYNLPEARKDFICPVYGDVHNDNTNCDILEGTCQSCIGSCDICGGRTLSAGTSGVPCTSRHKTNKVSNLSNCAIRNPRPSIDHGSTQHSAERGSNENTPDCLSRSTFPTHKCKHKRDHVEDTSHRNLRDLSDSNTYKCRCFKKPELESDISDVQVNDDYKCECCYNDHEDLGLRLFSSAPLDARCCDDATWCTKVPEDLSADDRNLVQHSREATLSADDRNLVQHSREATLSADDRNSVHHSMEATLSTQSADRDYWGRERGNMRQEDDSLLPRLLPDDLYISRSSLFDLDCLPRSDLSEDTSQTYNSSGASPHVSEVAPGVDRGGGEDDWSDLTHQDTDLLTLRSVTDPYMDQWNWNPGYGESDLVGDTANFGFPMELASMVVDGMDTLLMDVLQVDFMLTFLLQRMPELLPDLSGIPTPTTVIDHLPLVTVDDTLIEQYPSCPICLASTEMSDQLSQLPCQHVFHPVCVRAWLNKSSTCPVCRQSVMSQ